MRRLFPIAFFSLALAGVASAQDIRDSPLEGITNAQARSLPPGELADRAFRAAAARMRSVTRPHQSRGDEGEAPYELVFATAAESAGDPGQCRATVVHVGALRGFDTQISEPGVIATEIVYKVVGEVDLGDGDRQWSVEQQEAQQALCARTGPVIRADSADDTQPVFFQFAGSRIPTLPLIALQRAIRGPRDGSYANIACDRVAAEEAPDACRSARALLGGFDLADLTSLEVSRPIEGQGRYRVVARFRIVGGNQWNLTLDFDLSISPEARRVLRLGHGEIARGLTFDISDGPEPPSD